MADKTVVVRAVYRSNVAQGMRQDAGAITGFSAKVESSAAKSVNATRALGVASAVAGKLMLLGIGGAMAVSAKAGIDFESAMAGVAKTTDLTGNSFDRNSGSLFAFGEALRGLALRTPIKVNDLAAIAEIGGQLGIESENLIEFTEVMAQLGVTTNLSATEAATGLAKFANIMDTPQNEFDRLGSIVVDLGNNLATTEADILKFGTRLAPVGAAVGATEEEVFALAAGLSALGVPAERGGSAIQQWMIKAKKATEEGGEKLELFAEVAGTTSEEFAAMFSDSPAQAFVEFSRGLDRVNTSGGDLFGTLDALELSNIRTTQALLAAAGGVEQLDSALLHANTAGDEASALYEEAAIRFGTTASQIQLLVNAFEDLEIEIGNAMLSGGGLAFAIDVLKEFFGIVKDNLGVIKGLATVMGILVAIRLGLFFFQAAEKAQMAIQSFRNAAIAAQTLSTTSRLAQGGMLLLTGVMQGAIGIAGLLAAAWGFMAINAAQAKAEAKALREEIENGADPLDLFTEKIRESLNDAQLRQLNEMGFSVRDLTQYLMEGRPAASEFGQAIEDIVSPDGMENKTRAELQRIGVEAVAVNEILDGAGSSVKNFFKVRTNELRDAFIETGNAAGFTVDRIDELAGMALNDIGFEITDSQFIDWVENATHVTGSLADKFLQAGNQASTFAGELGTTTERWQNFLDPEGREDFLEDFFNDNIDAVGDFVDQMKEDFDAVGEVVRGGMPVWEEYHKAVLGGGESEPISFQAALDAQKAFLEDTRDWIERMPDITQMGASADTLAWIDSLETPIRGAIGRLNDAQLEELISGANRNFDELNKLHLLRWMQVYPDNANLAFSAMVGDLTNRVGEMNLPGEYAAQAFTDGIMDMMSSLPENSRADFLSFLAELLNNEEWMKAQGLGEMGAYIEGLLIEAGLLAGKVNSVLDSEFQSIKDHVTTTWGIQSPSKWWRKIGEQFTAGLEEGARGMSASLDFSPDALMPSMSPGLGSMSTINNSRASTYNLSVTSGGNQPNIRAEAQTLLTLLTIVGGVEQGAGR